MEATATEVTYSLSRICQKIHIKKAKQHQQNVNINVLEIPLF